MNIKIPCPHCGQPMRDSNMARHRELCRANPAAVERAKSLMLRLATNGVACGRGPYDRSARAAQAPGSQTIIAAWGKTWDAWCAECGLLSYTEHQSGLIARSLDELRRLSRELHDGLIGPDQAEYQTYAQDVISTTYARQIYRSWRAFLTAAGLIHGPLSYYKEAGKIRRAELDARLTRELREAEYRRRKLVAEGGGLIVVDRGVREIYDWNRMQTVTVQVYECK